MATFSWKDASRSKGDEIIKMKKFIPFYSYADERNAILTDKKYCELLRSELIKSKTKLSDTLDIFYKLKIESAKFERQKDDFDILLDEIEVKAHKWDEKIPKDFLEMIIEYDWKLLEKARRLKEDLNTLLKNLEDASRQKIIDEETYEKIKISTDVVVTKIDEITRMFKERSAAFEINQTILRDAFEKIKDMIRRTV